MSSPNPVQTVLSALRDHGNDPKTAGQEQWSAKCPAHDDQVASLSVGVGRDGRVVLKCHAGSGCPTDDIVRALGLKMSDLFEPSNDRPEIVATYDYVDENGNLLFQAVRFFPKDFRQRRPDPSARNGWSWNLNGTRRVVYRLPQVQEAIKYGEPIYVVEGEKDVEALERAGMAATCNPMGAGKWTREHSQMLDGAAQAVVVPDRDKAGYAHALTVALSLEDHVREVVVAQPTEGKDVSDHLQAGKDVDALEVLTVDELRQLGGQTPEPEPERPRPQLKVVENRQEPYSGNGRRVENRPSEEDAEPELVLTPASAIATAATHWLWDKRIPLGELTLLGGREGMGKSTIAYDIAADVTLGKVRGYYQGEPKQVIVCATEDSWVKTINPRLMAANADRDRVFRAQIEEVSMGKGMRPLVLPTDIKRLERRILSEDVKLLLLDPLLSRLTPRLDTHKDAEVRLALEPLVEMIHETNVTCIGLIHVNKSASGDALSMLMGSRAFVAAARAVMFVSRDPDDDEIRLLGFPKENLGNDNLPPMRYRIEARIVDRVYDEEKNRDEDVEGAKIVWNGEDARDFLEVVESATQMVNRTEIHEAVDWLQEYLTHKSNGEESSKVKADAKASGIGDKTLQRAAGRLKVEHHHVPNSFPRRTFWVLPGTTVRWASASGDVS